MARCPWPWSFCGRERKRTRRRSSHTAAGTWPLQGAAGDRVRPALPRNARGKCSRRGFASARPPGGPLITRRFLFLAEHLGGEPLERRPVSPRRRRQAGLHADLVQERLPVPLRSTGTWGAAGPHPPLADEQPVPADSTSSGRRGNSGVRTEISMRRTGVPRETGGKRGSSVAAPPHTPGSP